jgi:hypothetical protein
MRPRFFTYARELPLATTGNVRTRNFSPLTIAHHNIKPPTSHKRAAVPKNPDMVSEELVESQDTEEALDIGEVEDAE